MGITNFALFVEKGVRASGLIATKTEPLSFDRNALDVIAPKVIDYRLTFLTSAKSKYAFPRLLWVVAYSVE